MKSHVSVRNVRRVGQRQQAARKRLAGTRLPDYSPEECLDLLAKARLHNQ